MRIKKTQSCRRSFRKLNFEIAEERRMLACSVGDSNLDGQVDSSDLVHVFKNGEYEDLILENSTCEEGDWNGSDDFDSGDLVTLFASGLYYRGFKQPGVDGDPLVAGGQPGDNTFTLIYDPATGSVDIDVPNLDELSTLQIQSLSGSFQGLEPASFVGIFDVFYPHVAFKLDPSGFTGPLNLGPILPAGWTISQLLADLRLDGSYVAGGGFGTADLQIVGADTTPPVLVVPDDIVAEAQGPGGAVVVYPAPSVSDDQDLSPVVSCSPPSGSTFTFAGGSVSCVATDSSGNSSQDSFNVSVVDTTPPDLSLIGDDPISIDLDAVFVDPGVTVSDVVDPAPTVTVFDDALDTSTPGSYEIIYQASDFFGNTAVTQRTVNVIGSPLQQIDRITAFIYDLFEQQEVNKGQTNSLVGKLEKVSDFLNKGKTKTALNKLQAFANQVTDLIDTGVLAPEQGSLLLDYADKLQISLENE